MARKTTRWDAADTLETKEDIAAYLDAVLEDSDPDLLKAALGDIARAKGMTAITKAAGLGRANLYKALSPDGNPEFSTVARVLKAIGLGSPLRPDASGGAAEERRPEQTPPPEMRID
jgi:probable addiction module antidote protein